MDLRLERTKGLEGHLRHLVRSNQKWVVSCLNGLSARTICEDNPCQNQVLRQFGSYQRLRRHPPASDTAEPQTKKPPPKHGEAAQTDSKGWEISVGESVIHRGLRIHAKFIYARASHEGKAGKRINKKSVEF